jgi:hypothetical protein
LKIQICKIYIFEFAIMIFQVAESNEKCYFNIMEKKELFNKLKENFGTHKKAAEFIGLSYTRYNEWRWNPDVVPAYGIKLLELAVESVQE